MAEYTLKNEKKSFEKKAILKVHCRNKVHCNDVIMCVVEIWEQERGKERVSGCPTCEQKRR